MGGGKGGWGGDVELKFMQQEHEGKIVKKIPGHYQPHGSNIFFQNRLSEKYSNVAAVEEMKADGGGDEVTDQTSSRSESVDFKISNIIHHAGFHVCPFHKTQVSGLQYIDTETTYPEGRLSAEQSAAHHQALKDISSQEWQPDYYHEVGHKSRVELELTHNSGESLTPRIESRRQVHEKLNEKSIYEPNMNVGLTRLDSGEELDEGKLRKVPRFSSKRTWNAGTKGGAYYQKRIEVDGLPVRAKWVKDITNMSNRVKVDHGPYTYDRAWKWKARASK